MNTDLADDLVYLKDLAEAGAQAPLLGGRFLAWWGGLVTLAYSGHYAIASGLVSTDPIAYAYLWSAFGVIGLLGYFGLVRTMSPDKPGQSSVGNRVEANVWMIAGFALFAYFGTLTVQSIVTSAPASGFVTSLPLVFTAYAIGLFTSGAIAKNGVLRTAGFGALGMVALSTWFAGTVFIWAIAGLVAFLTVFVPGLLLLRREPKTVV